MKRIIYISRAAPSLRAHDIARILLASRRNHQANGMSGFRVYRSGHFLQVLEGLDQLVDQTYAAILKDTRHTNCDLISDDVIYGPDFGNWLMAFWTDEVSFEAQVQGLTSIDSLLSDLNSVTLADKANLNLRLYDLITSLGAHPNAA